MAIDGIRSKAAPLTGQAAGAASGQDPLLKAAREFESLFLRQLLQEARQANAALSGTERSFDRDIYEGWQDEQFASSMSLAGGIGLAETIYRQLAGASLSARPRTEPEAASRTDGTPEPAAPSGK